MDDNNQDSNFKEAVRQFIEAHLQGKAPDIEELVSEYPEYEHQIRQKIEEFHKVDSLFDSIVQADDSEFEDTVIPNDLVGQKLASFEVEKVIGSGGMGVVYLARDTKLERSVAIKSLPSRLLSSSSAKARFKREAKLLASMNHSNIAVIYDIIEHDAGNAYLILEYIPGQTLAERITRESLNLDEALSIGQQIAEAVSAAHDKGVIHRDLKPGNIKITPEGKVKILDFGLAKTSVSELRSDEITVTQPSRIMGTPAYMSPEQARGKDTDHRTDIWSFGCIMYEMLTGHLPFEGQTATDTIARILERQPDWEILPQEIPTNIRTLLRRCLEKDTNRRLRDIGDAGIEIKETLNKPANAEETRPGRIKSLAVLPLQNLTRDPEQEYFADGLTEALIANLGKIESLHVRSRTSIMQYKETRKPLPEIARELKADAVVEGSVFRISERVRITVQLIHAPTDTHIWVDSYERDLCDILTLLSEVARTIANQIKIKVTPEQEALLETRRQVNPETYEAYLKGMFHLNKMTPEGTQKGLSYLHQAIEKDPEDPLAYGGLALGYAASAHAPGAPSDALARTEEAALKALKLDENLAEAHAALAHIKLYRDWDWEAAERAFQRAFKLNPRMAMTHAHHAFYLLIFEHKDEALAEMRQVEELDPLMPLWPAYQGWLYWWSGQYEEAINQICKSLDLAPDFPLALYVQGSAYAEKGMYEEAIKAHQRAGILSREWRGGLGRTYAMAGRLDEAKLALTELESDSTLWDTWFIAQINAVLGEKDEAFRWLKKAFGPPNHPYVPWIRQSPALKLLQDDPRFDEFLSRLNFPE